MMQCSSTVVVIDVCDAAAAAAVVRILQRPWEQSRQHGE